MTSYPTPKRLEYLATVAKYYEYLTRASIRLCEPCALTRASQAMAIWRRYRSEMERHQQRVARRKINAVGGPSGGHANGGTLGTLRGEAVHELSRRVNEETKYEKDDGGHSFAMASPNPKDGFEYAIVGMIRSLAIYADDTLKTHEGKISEDGVLGEHWLDAMKAVKGLLDGETGPRLNRTRLSALLTDMVRLAGFGRGQ